MKSSFVFSLRGRDWWKPFLIYWLIFIAEEVVVTATRGVAESHPGKTLLIQLPFTIILMIVAAIFTILFLRILTPRLSYADESFAFRGKVGEYVWLNVAGILLTIVTLGVFYAWFLRRVTSYLASKTSYKGTEIQFLGRGGRLFVRLLLGIVVPMVVFIVALAGFFVIRGPQTGQTGNVGNVQLITMLVTFFLILYVFVVLVYLIYEWYVDFSWKDLRIRWKTTFWRSCGFVLGQVLLSMITLSVYSPAAFVKIYQYFAEKTVVSRGETEIGRLGFEGHVGKGFGLIWGQTLLSFITLGFYLPWAIANIGRWMVGYTFVQRTDR